MPPKINILKPELVWVEDRCYRKLPIRQKKTFQAEDDDLYPIEPINKYGEEDYSDVPMKTDGSGEAWVLIHTAQKLAYVVKTKPKPLGRKSETDGSFARISVQPHGDSAQILIKGENKKCVADEYKRIINLLETARLRQDFTHFVSLPMNFNVLQKNFMKFKWDVLENCSKVRGLDKSIFQDPDKLHLTIVPVVLLCKQDIEEATAILQSCKDTVRDLLQGLPLALIVKGVEYMNDDPSEVDVLYAKVKERDDNQHLQIIADKILEKFNGANLAKKQDNTSVKLHITLMNTIFRKAAGAEDDDQKRRKTFDARQILKEYQDYDFGVVEVKEIHVSIRYTTGNNGYFKSSSVLKLSG